MQRSRFVLVAALALAWMALAVWQWYDYGEECRHARETLVRQADSIMQALTGGIRSHRRLGYFFVDQLQGVLEELVAAKDVLAAAVVSEDGRLVCSAGIDDQLPQSVLSEPEVAWESGSLRYVKQFELPPRSEEHPGPGRGLGRGRGLRWMQAPDADEAAPFAEGGAFTAILALDARPVAEQVRRAAVTRLAIVAAGALVLIFLAIVWRTTFRLAEARGRERLLETETRYLRELSQAAAGLAHETRNPLGLIRGWTQRLAEPNPSDDGRRQAQAVIEECDRLTARINQFLAFARPAEPNCEDVSLAVLAGELASLLEPDLQGKGIQLDCVTGVAGGVRRANFQDSPADTTRGRHPSRDDTAPSVRADRELLRQALFNLIQNAVQASPEGGTVEVRLLPRKDGRCRLEVADSGAGVPPDLTDKLFTPYFTTRKGGTGLGLAIVRRIATAHGWQAGYTLRPGGGALFWLDGLKPVWKHNLRHAGMAS